MERRRDKQEEGGLRKRKQVEIQEKYSLEVFLYGMLRNQQIRKEYKVLVFFILNVIFYILSKVLLSDILYFWRIQKEVVEG